MIERVLRFSIRNRVLVAVLAAVFALLGIVAFTRVPIDAVPDVTNAQVQVQTPAHSLGPLDVETYVTAPVERAMSGIAGLEEVRSISRSGISVVTLVFEEGTDVYHAREMVSQRLADAKRDIPEEYGIPRLGPNSSGLGEVFHFEVTSEGASLQERRQALDWLISPRLRLVPGVVEVNVFGGEVRTLELTLDPHKLLAAKVGVAEVIEALRRNHLAAGGAYIVDGRENVTVRGEGRIRTSEDLAGVVVETRSDRAPLYLRDLGEVHYAPMVRYGAVTRDGRADEAVVGVAMMHRGAHSSHVVEGVKAALADLSRSLPKGIRIEPIYDRADLVHRTIHTVSANLIEASLLVVLILALTLANLRAGAIVAISIPFALLGVFIGMWVGGVSGNLISLGAIDFGLVVDGAIIIVENALRAISARCTELGRPLTDQERQETVLHAAKEVRGATAFGEAIIALVYIPILALTGVEGRMFRPMAVTVLFALAAAFVLSLTLVPAMASWMLSKNRQDRESPFILAVHRWYRPLLARTMRCPRLSAVVAVVAFIGSLLLATTMGREFLPKLDEGSVVISSVRLPSVSLEQATAQDRDVERILKRFPEVVSVVGRAGRAEVAVDAMGINMTDVYVMLKPRKEWTTAHSREDLVDAFDRALRDEVPGMGFAYSQPIEMNTNDLLAGINSDVAVHVYGHDRVKLKQLGDRIVHTVRGIPGAKDVRAEQVAGMNVLSVTVDRAKIARYGISARAVMETIAALGGLEVGEVVDGAVRFPIQVRFDADARRGAESIASLPVRAPNGVLVPVGQLATIEEAPGPSQISRERLARRLTVQFNVRGRDLASFVEIARAEVEREIPLPTGFSLVWAGEYERLRSATKQLAVVVPIALALILVLLIATFNRTKPALLIFLNVPMSVSGGLFALFLRGLPLSISAGIGFIALFGVAVLNGLVLVSSIERNRVSMTPEMAVRSASEGRLRPVLTTALVASLGFLPMALASGSGAEVQRPLATVVIGGVVSSTLLTLFVLPTIYLWFAKRERASDEPTAALL